MWFVALVSAVCALASPQRRSIPLGAIDVTRFDFLSAPRLGLECWTAQMKPIADEIRKMSSFGSPKGGRVARPNEAKRGRRRVVQVDPSHGGTDGRVHRHGRWRGSVRAPASRIHGRPGIAGVHPAAGRASRGPLNGFPGALAGVLRHRIGAGRRRLSDTSATGLSDAAKAGERQASISIRPPSLLSARSGSLMIWKGDLSSEGHVVLHGPRGEVARGSLRR